MKNRPRKYRRKVSPAVGFKYVPAPAVVSKRTLSDMKRKREGWSLFCRKAVRIGQGFNICINRQWRGEE